MIDIKQKLHNFMLEELKEAGFHEEIRDDESLIDLNILDSLSILKLLSFLDEEFNIFPAADELEAEKIDTINRIAKFIAKKLEAQQ